MAGDHTKSELELLTIVDDEAVVSQSALSSRLGIATGLVNFLMKRAVSKGLVKVQKVPARRYAYYLTPKGFAEKAHLVADYLNTSLKMFRKLRDDFNTLFRDASAEGVARVIVIGDWELAEVALLASLDSDVEIAAIICTKTNRSRLGSIPVYSHIDQFDGLTADGALLVVDTHHAQDVYEDLAARFGPGRVMAPKSLRVTPVVDEEELPRMVGGRR